MAPRFVPPCAWNVLKTAYFFGNTVGAYGIRPTEWPRRGQECVSAIDHLDHSPHKWDVCGAYSIRPYTGTRKRGAFFIYHNRETIKRATFSTSHPIASPKGSLFFVSHLITCPERGAFCTCHNRETIQRSAFYVFQRMACPVCVALGYIAIVELLRRAAFHAFRGMA